MKEKLIPYPMTKLAAALLRQTAFDSIALRNTKQHGEGISSLDSVIRKIRMQYGV